MRGCPDAVTGDSGSFTGVIFDRCKILIGSYHVSLLINPVLRMNFSPLPVLNVRRFNARRFNVQSFKVRESK